MIISRMLPVLAASAFLLSSCAKPEPPKTESVDSAARLFHAVPESYGLRLLKALRNTDRRSYYYEQAKWADPSGELVALTEYQALFDNYVFSDDGIKTAREELQQTYEDMIVDQEEEVVLGEHAYNGSYIRFRTVDAACFQFRRFVLYGSAFGVVDGMPLTLIIGDHKITSYVCDFSGKRFSDQRILQWIDELGYRRVLQDQI